MMDIKFCAGIALLLFLLLVHTTEAVLQNVSETSTANMAAVDVFGQHNDILNTKHRKRGKRGGI